MQSELTALFFSVGIEYFASLDFRDVRVTKQYLIDRCSFAPRSAIVFVLPYFVSHPENISAYAASLDYHLVISEITDRLILSIKSLFPDSHAVGFGDHSPIDERHAALIGGIGILGDNGLIINEKYGSYIFIGEIITDIDPHLLGASAKKIEYCEHCGACIAACPTGILGGAGEDCLSAITQKKGELTESDINLMIQEGTVWGCDACQNVCPHNQNVAKSPIDYFYENRVECLTREILSEMSDEELSRRAFGWRGRAVLERNLDAVRKREAK